ncbi:MAG: tetratricopeptide repeat protein [Promethearchaeota archaeon]
MIEIKDKQLPKSLPLLAAILITIISLIVLTMIDNYLRTTGLILFFGWPLLISIFIFLIVFLSLSRIIKRQMLQVYNEDVLQFSLLLDNPYLSRVEMHEYAAKLDKLFEGLEPWIDLSEDDYFKWSRMKEILDKREEALKLVEKCLYINPMNEHAFWKLIYHLRYLGKEIRAIKYLDVFSVIKEPGVKNLWKSLVYEQRYPKEAKAFYEQSIREGIRTESLDLNQLNEYLESITDSDNLMKHKEIFRENLGEYWDFLTFSFPEATILEIFYILEKVTEKYGTDWLEKTQRFT